MGAENVNLGTCKIELGGTDLGLTIGGVEVEVSTTTHITNVDQFGETVVSEHITGRNVKVKLPLAETTVENMAATLPGATLVVDGVDSSVVRVDVATGIGINLLDAAQVLRLHPIALDDSDHSEDFVIPLAATPGGVQFAYKHDEERVFLAEFMGYPDSTTGLLYYYGDDAATP